jgi:hypothetical protein
MRKGPSQAPSRKSVEANGRFLDRIEFVPQDHFLAQVARFAK